MAPKKTKDPTTERHTTIAGETLEYPTPAPGVAAFLARVRDASNDPNVSEAELVELIYGSENPILDHTLFRGRGAVTKEVFADPLYHVMLDLLDAKRVQTGSLDVERAGAQYTMTVAEAAEQIGITPGAVRQAIAAKNLAAWKRGGVYFLDPHSVGTYRDHVKRRGPRPEPALRITMGNREGASFRVKASSLEVLSTTKLEGGGKLIEAIVPRFTRAAVAFSGKRVNRMFVIEPADEEDFFAFEGFELRGKYQVVEKVNDAEAASKRFRSFKAE